MFVPFFMLLTPALCLIQPAPAPLPAPAQPSLVYDSLHHDFGRIPGDAKVTHRFKVTNQGKVSLHISRLHPSCGCTSTVLGKWTLGPGEATEIEVTFNPAGFRGLSRKSIQVTSDDAVNPTQTLTFDAEVIREINPVTESVFFQDVVRSVPRKASVKLESGNGKPVQITDLKAADAPWLALGSHQAGLDAVVDLVLDGRKVPGGKQMGADLITIATTSAKVPTIKITVQWELHAVVTADPVRVAWVEPAGQERSSTLTLKHADNKPFRILSARSSNPGILKVEPGDKGASPTHKVQVILSAKAKPGNYTDKVLLTLDDPDQPELEIRVSAALR